MPLPSDVPVPVHAPGSPLAQIARLCQRIARSDSTVLLTGETGTGKEVFARMIHAASARAQRMLVPVNCGAIPEALLESELFGYVRGAFTGASAARKGRIAAAEGGTLFLDEVGEMPLPLQVKLLRVLQERTYEPIGSAESVRADIRLVAATNRNLAAEVEAGRFREDLYYRLLVCPVELPPLRARRADVPVLFDHFWKRRGETRPVDDGVYAALSAYDWPGNVRELENLAERLSVCVEGPRIRLEDLPPHLRGGTISLGSAIDAVLAIEPDLPPPDETAAPAEAQVPTAVPAGDAPRPAAPAEASRAAAPPAPPADASTATPDGANEAAPASIREAFAEAARRDEEGAPARNDPPDPLEAVLALDLPLDLPRFIRELEDRLLERALARTNGNKRAAADLLGLQRTTLVEKLRRRARRQSDDDRGTSVA